MRPFSKRMQTQLEAVVLVDGRNLGGCFNRWRHYDLNKLILNVIGKIEEKTKLSIKLIRVFYYYSIIDEIAEDIPEQYRIKWTNEKKKTRNFLNRVAAFPL